jgi:hypothetical protein
MSRITDWENHELPINACPQLLSGEVMALHWCWSQLLTVKISTITYREKHGLPINVHNYCPRKPWTTHLDQESHYMSFPYCLQLLIEKILDFP